MASIVRENKVAYQSKLSLKKWDKQINNPQGSCHKGTYPFPHCMTKTAATGSKHIKICFSGFLNNICHIPEWILLVFKNFVFFKIPFMASFNVLFSDPHSFQKKLVKN